MPAEVEQAIQGERRAGSGLPEPVRSRMEWAFGTGLDSVRVHTGPRADFASRALGARAFATGRDIFFRQGEYAPERALGQRVLAHELAHVVQQGDRPAASGPGIVQRKVGFEVEMSVPVTRHPRGAFTALDFLQGGLLGSHEVFPRGRGRFRIETDHDDIGDKTEDLWDDLERDHVVEGPRPERRVANMEYVLDAVDELEPGSQRDFRAIIDATVGHMRGVWADDPPRRRVDLYRGTGRYGTGVPADEVWQAGINGTDLLAGYPDQIRAIRNAVRPHLYLQATAGILPTEVTTLLRGAGRSRDYSRPESMDLNAQSADYATQTVSWLTDEADFRSAEERALRGWLALIYSYLLANELYQTDGKPGGNYKNFVTFLSKVDLGSARLALPTKVRQFLDGMEDGARRRLIDRILDDVYEARQWIRKQYHPRDEDPLIEDVRDFIDRVLKGQSPRTGLRAVDDSALLNLDRINRRAEDLYGEIRRAIPLEYRAIDAHPDPDHLEGELLRIVDDVRELNTNHLPSNERDRVIRNARRTG